LNWVDEFRGLDGDQEVSPSDCDNRNERLAAWHSTVVALDEIVPNTEGLLALTQ